MSKQINAILKLAKFFQMKLAGKAADLELNIKIALKILGLSETDFSDCDLDSAFILLKKSYRKKTLEVHPDLVKNDPEATDNQAILNKTYEFLKKKIPFLLADRTLTMAGNNVFLESPYAPIDPDGKYQYMIHKCVYLPKNGRTYSSSEERSLGEKKFKTIEETVEFISQNLTNTKIGFIIGGYGNGSSNWFGHIRFDPTENRWYYLPVNFITPDYNERNPFSDWEDVSKEIVAGETGPNPQKDKSNYAPYGAIKRSILL